MKRDKSEHTRGIERQKMREEIDKRWQRKKLKKRAKKIKGVC